MTEKDIFEKFEELLSTVTFDHMDPENFWVIADGVEYTGAEGLIAFRKKHGLEESDE